MNLIDIDAFIAFCKTLVGQEFDTVGKKSKFTLQNISEHALYYQMATDKLRKQNIRYVKRVLEQYAKIQSLNPGHYTNITQNGPFILALIQLYENRSRGEKS
jgi:hypothetical protein